MMQNYELTVVAGGKQTTAKKKSLSEKVNKLVKDLGGKVAKGDDWGDMELSYKIRKFDTGSFLFYEIELEKDKVKKLNGALKLNEDIIRYLIVKGNR